MWKSYSHRWYYSHLRLTWLTIILMELEWVGPQLFTNRNGIIINNLRIAPLASLQPPWNSRWVLCQATQPMRKSTATTISRVIDRCQWAGKTTSAETLHRMASISNSRPSNFFSKQRSWGSRAVNISRRSQVGLIRAGLYLRRGLARAGSLCRPMEALNVRQLQWPWRPQKVNNLKEEAMRHKQHKYN